MELEGKVAIVTGAAKRIGCAIAEQLANQGAAVAVHYRRSADEAAQVVERIAGQGGCARSFAANLERIGEIEAMVQAVAAEFGRIDVLVNCASVFQRQPMDEITEADWDLNLNTNLKAPFFLAKYVAPHMRSQGAGKIVNIGDWAGIRPYNHYLPYSVSKSGLIGLTHALAKALAPHVQVNCVAVGPVLPPDDYDQAEIAKLVKGTLTGKIGSPDDVARAVLFFCQGTDFATGATLVLDGGRLIN